MPDHLVPLNGGPAVPLDKALIFFGRHAECDVVLTGSRKVSRKHCCVAQINDEYVVRDLGSMNGVRVNGKPVELEVRLHPGDELSVGDVGFRFERSGAKPAKDESEPKADSVPKPAASPTPPLPAAPASEDVPVLLADDEETLPPERDRDLESAENGIAQIIIGDDAADDEPDEDDDDKSELQPLD